ncbi:MAG: C40 family peptidase, partial [Pseudomonadota bacterium]|nr:C40 family peptidase [Pseudomonadota bacterium]
CLRALRPAAGALFALLLAACASAPRAPAEPGAAALPSLGQRIVASAMAEVGKPYRYGGNGPDAYDCSGLVRFAHGSQGVIVPRTTEEQFRAARPVPVDRIAAGDLLFFRFDGPKVSHVAIYAGDGRFVHAPQSDRPVEVRSLDEPWYRSQLVGAGRLH